MKAVVFGGNSTIAKEVQKVWASRGYSLVLIGRDAEHLKSVRADLIVRGAAAVEIVEKDLSDYDGADGFVSDLWDVHQGFDVVFMAYGALGAQGDDEVSSGRTIKMLKINMISHCAFLTPIANLMEQRRQGAIAVITSVAGDRGKQSNYIYCAAKAGKIAFLSGLRNRLFSKGVHVVDLRLGFVDTEMTKAFKKGPLWVKPRYVAVKICDAIDAKKDVVYLPHFWWIIMIIIKSIPEFVFKRLQL